MADLSLLKRSPMVGVPTVEELEQPNGERCLSPTKEWTASVSDLPQGQALSALYMMMGMMGAPAPVILTVAAVKFADLDKKIDWETWINTRSNWMDEDKKGAIQLLKSIDARIEQIKSGVSSPFSLKPPAAPAEAAPAQTKKPEDDWNIN